MLIMTGIQDHEQEEWESHLLFFLCFRPLENAYEFILPHLHSFSLSPFQCPDRFLEGLETGIVNCQISCLALIPLSKILSNIKSCEIGGRFLIILITAFFSLLKRARRNRFRSGNYPCSPVPGSGSALECQRQMAGTGEGSSQVGAPNRRCLMGGSKAKSSQVRHQVLKSTPKSIENDLTFIIFSLSARCF